MSKGIVLMGEDADLKLLAKSKGYAVMVEEGMPLAFEKTLFVEPGTEVPWDLLEAGFHFLERWDAAIPLWRYGVIAADVGTAEERKKTKQVVRDLRVLLYAVELLFVRDNADGQALLAAYKRERTAEGNQRLAFLRAFYEVKPRMCVLPRSWLAEIYQRSKMTSRTRWNRRHTARPLVEVEVSPGRFVKCHAGDEEVVLEMMTGGRRGGKGRKVN